MLPFTVELILLFLCVRPPNFVKANNSLAEKSFIQGDNLNTVFDVLRKATQCRSLNLNISIVPDLKNYYMDVAFEVSEDKFKDCYEYYNVTLRNLKRKDVTAAMVRYDEEAGASHQFENISCGTYEVAIQCCPKSWRCIPFFVMYPDPVNMIGIECLGYRSDKLLSHTPENSIIVLLTIISVMLILTVGAVSFCFYWSADRKCKWIDFIIKKKDGTMTALEDAGNCSPRSKEPPKRNDIIILHRHNKLNNRRVCLLKDFLEKTDYYESVTTIEYSLSNILFKVEDCVDKMLKTSKGDGGVCKIILIASESDAEAKDHEMENLLFSKFLDRINDDSEKFLKGYDHLFVAQFDKHLENPPEEIRNVVRRVRFILSEKLLEDHLVNLCLNLCSASEQNSPHIEGNLRELFVKHPVKLLGVSLLDV